MTMQGPSPRRRQLALALGTLLLFSAGAQAASTLTPWVGSWAVAQKPIGDASPTGKTLRHIVHTSIGGSSARVHLSNAYGDGPLTISDIHVAVSAGGSSVRPETDHLLTVNGLSSVTLAAGQEVDTDGIDMAVPALSDVGISFYVSQAPAALTGHDFSGQTRYDATGDVAGQATINAGASQNYVFVTNLDVQGPAPQGAVVLLGASISNGTGSSFNENTRWSNDFAARLVNAGKNVGVINEGIAGNTLLRDGSGPSAANRFDHDVLGQPGARWVIFSDDPINDLGDRPVPSADALIAAEQSLITRAHNAGFRFLCSTLTPFQGSGSWSQEGETARQKINAFIRSADSGCDGIVDQDAATHDPANPTQYLPAYDSGDHLHPNDAGHQAIANAIDLTLFTPPGQPAIAPPTGCGSIGPGEGILPGQSVTSCDGGYHLGLQNDSNGVLYKATGASLWTTGTYNRGAGELRLDPDGNLVVYGSLGTKLWQSNSGGHPDARLFVQGDGNLVIYDANGPIWSSSTAGQ